MRHRAGRFGNDRGVAGIGLGFAGMQIGDAAHGQSRQIGDEYAFSAGDGHWECANGGRLVDDEQESAMSLEFSDEGTQLGLVVGSALLYRRLPFRSSATA